MGEYAKTYDAIARYEVTIMEIKADIAVLEAARKAYNNLGCQYVLNKYKDTNKTVIDALASDDFGLEIEEEIRSCIERIGELEVSIGECRGYLCELRSIDGEE